ncbi:MAG: hypothetical protein IKU48_01410 [Clostridia bacterium]|nr:hypothetical protein [Clostridia bacterium]
MKKLLSITLCLLMILSTLAVFTACGGSESSNNSDYIDNDDQFGILDNDNNQSGDENQEQAKDEKEEVAISEEKGNALPSKLVANKIASYNESTIMVYNGGYLYGKDGKIGISSFDGKSNSGAIYTSAKGEENYFIVATTDVKTDPTNINTLNVFGLVDVTGRVIVPCEYASISVLNERYVKVCVATETTTDKESAMIYASKDGSLSFTPKDDDYFFNGVWYIYDITNGQKVEGATGKKAVNPRVKNNIISFTNDEGKDIVINEKGVALSEDADVMSDGSYLLGGKMYGNDGSELFTIKKNGFEPTKATDDGKYYVASKYSDGETRYVIMDKTGKIVSVEFTKSIYVYGLLIENQDKVYNFKGEQIIDGEVDSIYYSTGANIEIYVLEKDDVTTVLDGAFNIIYTGELTDDMRAYKSYGVISQTIDKVSTSYNYTTKDFSVEGYSNGFLTTLGGKYPSYNLNDAISGNTLIAESRDISLKKLDGTLYAVARTDTAYDIYTIVAG